MKNLKRLEKILLIIITFAVLFSITTVNKAVQTGDPNDLFQDIPQVPDNTQQQQPQNIPTPENTNVPTNTNTSLPGLGANDTAMWVLIAVCTVAAIYTYKKVRDYNI